MNAEEIISMDSKTARKVLNYQGPVFLRMPKLGTYLFEVREKHCRKCGVKTRHEWVRDMDFNYWRCEECLIREIKETGIYLPPQVRNPILYLKNTTERLRLDK